MDESTRKFAPEAMQFPLFIGDVATLEEKLNGSGGLLKQYWHDFQDTMMADEELRSNMIYLPAMFSDELVAEKLNWISIAKLKEPMRVKARIRYRHEASPATISPLEGGAVRVNFTTPQRAITPGQATVFYDGDTVVGGGVIRTTEE